MSNLMTAAIYKWYGDVQKKGCLIGQPITKRILITS